MIKTKHEILVVFFSFNYIFFSEKV